MVILTAFSSHGSLARQRACPAPLQDVMAQVMSVAASWHIGGGSLEHAAGTDLRLNNPNTVQSCVDLFLVFISESVSIYWNVLQHTFRNTDIHYIAKNIALSAFTHEIEWLNPWDLIWCWLSVCQKKRHNSSLQTNTSSGSVFYTIIHALDEVRLGWSSLAVETYPMTFSLHCFRANLKVIGTLEVCTYWLDWALCDLCALCASASTDPTLWFYLPYHFIDVLQSFSIAFTLFYCCTLMN